MDSPTDATHEMGCLQVVRGGHKGGVVRHYPENQVGGDKAGTWIRKTCPQARSLLVKFLQAACC